VTGSWLISGRTPVCLPRLRGQERESVWRYRYCRTGANGWIDVPDRVLGGRWTAPSPPPPVIGPFLLSPLVVTAVTTRAYSRAYDPRSRVTEVAPERGGRGIAAYDMEESDARTRLCVPLPSHSEIAHCVIINILIRNLGNRQTLLRSPRIAISPVDRQRGDRPVERWTILKVDER
jgi:hypothetical protein